MKRRSLLWKVLPWYIATVMAAVALSGLYAYREMKTLYLAQTRGMLEARARIVSEEIHLGSGQFDPDQANARCGIVSTLSDTRITVVDATGAVLVDSEENPSAMENHGHRAEIAQALAGGVGVATRYSNTLQTTMVYVAVPVQADDRIVGVVRTSRPLTAVEQALSSLYRRLLIGGLVIAVLATGISVFVFRRLTLPLRMLSEGAERFAGGDFSTKLAVPDTGEIAGLAEAMNAMASQLDSRIQAVLQQRNEREAILSSISEGVVALDAGERVTSVNRAAAQMLGLDVEKMVGQSIFGVVRISALHGLIREAVDRPGVAETEFPLTGPEEKHVLAHATRLLDAAGNRTGVVLVLANITHLKQLEKVRREFVANVSHELKTPITAIKGSVETLLDGAIDSSDDRRRFLEMLSHQATRLGSLVDDLLSLARLEVGAETGRFEFSRHRLVDVVRSAAGACREQAEQKSITVDITGDREVEADLNPAQLEQALINLIDNAIQYSDRSTRIAIEVRRKGDQAMLAVTDEGSGIEARHLGRIFERFYRVDPARSRATGGTGLGLAIVKHVALSHQGWVDVESKPGAGSTFRIRIPLNRK